MENSIHAQALKAYKSMVLIASKSKAGELQFASSNQAEAFWLSYENTKKMLDYVATGDQDSVRRLYKAAIQKTATYWKEMVAA